MPESPQLRSKADNFPFMLGFRLNSPGKSLELLSLGELFQPAHVLGRYRYP
jgi:hypothetical protein